MLKGKDIQNVEFLVEEMQTFCSKEHTVIDNSDASLEKQCRSLARYIDDEANQIDKQNTENENLFCSSLFIDVSKYLYRKGLFEEVNYSQQISIIQTLHNHLGNIYYFNADSLTIQQLLLLGASLHPKEKIDLNRLYPMIHYSAESARYLKTLGLHIQMDLDSFTLSEQSTQKAFRILEQKIETLSGNHMLAYLMNECIANKFCKELSRFLILRSTSESIRNTAQMQERTIPFNLLLQLSVKHLRKNPPNITIDERNKEAQKILNIAQALLDIAEFDERSPMEYAIMNIEQFPLYLSRELYCEKLCIPQQYGKRYIMLLLDELIQPYFDDSNTHFRYRDYRRVAEYLLDMNYGGGMVFTAVSLHNALKISLHKIQAILDVLSQEPGEINKNYHSFNDSTTLTDKPLVHYPFSNYQCMPLVFCGIGFYKVAYNLIHKRNPQFDRVLGKRIESMVIQEIEKKGFHFLCGQYGENQAMPSQGECDIVMNGKRLCFFEIKKKECNRELDMPNDVDMLETLSKGMVHAQVQCFHHEKYLQDHGKIILEANNGKHSSIELNECQLPAFKISICLSEYSFLTSPVFSHKLINVLLLGKFETYDPNQRSKLQQLDEYAKKLRGYAYTDSTSNTIDLRKSSNYSIFLSVQQLLNMLWLSNTEEDFYDYIKCVNYCASGLLDPYTSILFHFLRQQGTIEDTGIREAAINMLDKNNMAAMFVDSI